ncbi:MAG: helix-turn-helix domain-containing protein [Methanocorpusculum sp.]|uniref:Helix-turn-helix domain-containing protein n=1 Tax=Methanocorpusculum petauri TaxID=3002863 RepID=A0ABT4IEZ7_9EURY|nr:helix-turn-helix domain-containing protein [Methanocorpusculum petauri]MCZ9313541.1 helix-turn-helix domain-containing protein [Methanocorpusculum sp.]MCZ0860308.1 helix-turn-helix domain-containing protein [Methanocorpusculum petauri]MDE2444304.1 helix-turn-helix domain-containing protein [Methanocorpusculum sp.]MDE2518616.1 helix-turn-helix domain-containing protein [Methanocorpusculum sp.]MDE2522634.1 helix-turn-helix domain-containing protein [Methanocorpusculum sp.]
MVTDETIVVVEQGSFEAQKIAKAMSSPTSADLFNALSDCPMSATALAERSELPLTTVKYHLENMLSAGLIEVTDTRWSAKGREMKIYAVKDQVVVIAPKKKVDIRGIVERYGVAAGALAVVCALGLAIPSTLLGFIQGTPLGPEATPTGAKNGLVSVNLGEPQAFALATPTDTAATVSGMPLWIHEAVMVFFIAGIVILALMMAYEVYSIRRDT